MKPTFGNAPNIFTAFHDTAVGGLHIFSGTNNREGHGINQNTSMLSVFIVCLQRRAVNPDSLRSNDFANLNKHKRRQKAELKHNGDTVATYALLEHEEVVLGQSVGLGDHGDEVNTGSEALHDFNVQRL